MSYKDLSENISHNIYCLKNLLKLSYSELGKEVGMKSAKIKRIVYKTQPAKLNEISAFADYFGYDILDFMTKKV